MNTALERLGPGGTVLTLQRGLRISVPARKSVLVTGTPAGLAPWWMQAQGGDTAEEGAAGGVIHSQTLWDAYTRQAGILEVTGKWTNGA